MLSLIPRLAPWPLVRGDLRSYPTLLSKTAFSAVPTTGLSGSIVQLSHLTYKPETGKLFVPLLHSDRTGRLAVYDVAGNSLTQAVSFAAMGGTGVLRPGAHHTLSRTASGAASGKVPAVVTWGTTSTPSGIGVGLFNETASAIEGFTTSAASIVSNQSNLNLQASIIMNAAGDVGLVQYIDGPDSTRYLKYRKVVYDQAQGKLVVGTGAQEFVGQQQPAVARYYKDSLFVVCGLASSGKAFAQLLDVSGDAPVLVDSAPALKASSLAWGKASIDVVGDNLVITYLDATGDLNAELFALSSTSITRKSTQPLGGFTTSSGVRDSIVLGDTVFALIVTGNSVDVAKTTIGAQGVTRFTVDRNVMTLDATYTQAYMAKISDTRLLFVKAGTTGAMQYQFVDYVWRVDLTPSKVLAQYRFYDGEAINEVGERFALLGSGATVGNGRLNTTTNTTSRIEQDQVYFGPDDDLTIEAIVKATSSGSNGYSPICQWNVGGSNNNSWAMSVVSGLLRFSWSSSGSASSTYLTSNTPVPTGIETHVAVVRKNGVFRLYVAGQQQNETSVDATANALNTRPVSTSWSDTTGWLNGSRGNIRISREALYDGDFQPPTELPTITRPTYSEQDQAACVFQLDLRRDNLLDEVTDNQVTFVNGTALTNGRIVTVNNTTSQYTCQSKKFGEGDFTAELMINLQAVSATYGAVIMGNWRAGGVASDENRWCIILDSNRNIGFNMARSADANDFAWMMSSTPVPLNVDCHIVAERVNGVVTLYLNGSQVAQSNETDFNFPIRGGEAGWKVHSISSQVAYTVGMRCWNLRIMDKAYYNGDVKRENEFPALSVKEYVIVNGAYLHPDFSLQGGATQTEVGVDMTAGKYILGTGSPKYVFYRGDFTVEATVTPRSLVYGTGAGSGSAIVPLWACHTWAAPGQPVNWELFLNLGTNQIAFGTSHSDSTLSRTMPYTFTLGQRINFKVVRRRSQMYAFVDDTLVGVTDMPYNIGYDITQPPFIGRRRGGGSGEVNWWNDVLLEKFIITKRAKM
ncbi:putative adhesin [Pseudomonas phage PaBG]|uniref:putative adhesin n=1 Tax=Pseudomonas phage PaBG TaxID=1335230 RepID=UPI00155F43E6|nr:putative adhesin [Pseudomonas phage PaBG]AGS82143.2 putative adhesin [Pseudomonas phage PaBG]